MPAQTARAATPQSPILLRETLGSIAVLTLNRPAARNSLSEGLIAELHAALERHSRRRKRARGGDRRQRPGLFRRPRHEGTDRAPRRCRSRARLFRRDHERLQRDDAGHRAFAEAGGRRGAGHRHRRRLPAGGKLRSRGGLGGRDLCHARRRYRTVLLDADGGAVAQRSAQAGDGNAAHRRAGFGDDRRARSASSTASSPPAPNAMRRSRWRKRSRSNPPTPSSSARPRSTARPK